MKKVRWLFMLVALILCMSIILTACGGNNTTTPPTGDEDGTQYTVTFDSQGGSAVAGQKVDPGSLLNVPTNPTKDNYYFDGWYVSTDANAKEWNFAADTVTATTTLYAKWLAYITVTFEAHNGEAVTTQPVPEGKFATRPTTPQRDNYDFIGWYKGEADDSEAWDFDSDTVKEPITLHAHWQPQSVTPSDNLTYTRNSNGYTVTGITGTDTVIVIPATHNGQPVTTIGESAFAYSRHNETITSVTISDSVTTIERNAFYNRSELVTVNISENSALTTVGNNAFAGCRALESIYIPAGVTSLGDNVFNNCGSLNNITGADGNAAYSSEGNNLIEKATNTLIRGTNNSTIPASVTTIAPRAFSRTTATELNIPVTVTTIGNYFIADSAYTVIRYQGTEEQWNAIEKSATMWNYGNRDVELVFSAQSTPEPTPSYEVEAPGAGPQSASNITSVGGVPLLTLNNGVQMPQFGLGTQIQSLENGDLGVLNQTSREAVAAALRAGYRHLDDAHGYLQERGVGQGIKDSGVPREEIWITDKLWPSEYANAAQAIDDMLDRLDVEYIDLLYLHHPAGTIANIESAWRAMEAAYRAGKIRALGISNFDNRMEAFNAIMDEEIKPQVMQIECHPLAQRVETRALATQYNIQVECWYPLKHNAPGLVTSNVLETIAEARGKSVYQIIIRWHIQEGFSVIPGSTNPAHIQENIDVFDFELTEAEMNSIRAMDQGESGRSFRMNYGNSLGFFGSAPREWNGTFQ